MGRPDPHSFADEQHPTTEHLDLEVRVDFERHTLEGVATLTLDRPAEGTLDLDSRDLAIRSIVDDRGEGVRFELGEEDPVLGRRLRLFTHRHRISIEYRTSPEASALQWLEPAQTAGGRHPFVYTQCQAIHARSIVPCQDTPRVRTRFDARLSVPAALTAVCAAAAQPTAEDEPGTFSFRMPQPIPSYLLAFAVGDLQSRELGPRSRVVAEPEVLDLACSDFAEVEAMVSTAEALFGPYAWDRFDLLVMPPSFPYGGMENPRLTFLTPTLLTGDRSLVNVVAHELAHAWTGNLVTNASIEHFWLNEGFTVFAERRIVEALQGPEEARLQSALGRRDLQRDLRRVGAEDPQLTALRTHLEGRDPDAVFSSIPYEKGCLFLTTIEAAIGRDEMDAFLRSYIERFRFQSITTETFESFMDEQLPGLRSRVDVAAWVHEPGLPTSAPHPPSEVIDGLRRRAEDVADDGPVDGLENLSPTEWQVFLSLLPDRLAAGTCRRLDERFGLARHPNAEIRAEFLIHAARANDTAADDAIREALSQWGRMKYLRAIYAALLRRGPEGRAFAEDVYAVAHHGYHPIARTKVAYVLESPV